MLAFRNKNNIFILFTFSVILILVLPELVQHGMFMDGVQYAIVSKNLSIGQGSFWSPYLSAAWNKEYNSSFLEHMPLSYFLQSLLFKVFGTGVFVEKAYCLLVLIVCIFLIYKIWDLIFAHDATIKNYWWLAVLFWFITPSVFWSFRSNMLENTVTLMVLAAVYFCLRAIYKTRYSLVYIFICALFIFMATLSKGLPGLFPVSIVLCVYFCLKNISSARAVLYTMILIAIPAALYFLFYYLSPDARASIEFYIKHRLLERINHYATVDNRLTILFWLLSDLLPIIMICALFIGIFKSKMFLKNIGKERKRLILFFLFFGLCGVIPLCLTHVQRAAYFVPALPFFGFASAIYLAGAINELIRKLSDKAFGFLRVSGFIFFMSVIAYSAFVSGKIDRDEKELTEVYKIGALIGNDKTIAVPFEIYDRWDFNFYLLRYYNITLYSFPTGSHGYMMFKKGYVPEATGNYKKMKTSLEEYDLYKLQN